MPGPMIAPARADRPRRRGSILVACLALALGSPAVVSPAAAAPPAWAKQQPGPETQHQKSKAERGGINPCNTPDPGFGSYGGWSRAPSMGQMIAPADAKRALGRDHGFDLMIHFHGHEAVRKEWVRVMDRAVLVGIDLGIGSVAYRAPFYTPAALRTLLQSVERAMADSTGDAKAHVRRLGLSAWSAGYGAVGQILAEATFAARVDSVVLLDGLHAGYVGGAVDELELAPFLAFARQASAGKKLMFASHSSIIPPGYASTTETMNYLVAMLGGRPSAQKPRPSDPMGLELLDRFDRGGFHVRGFAGNAKMDHCAHIGLFRDVLSAHVLPRWSASSGSAKKSASARKSGAAKPRSGKPKSSASKPASGGGPASSR